MSLRIGEVRDKEDKEEWGDWGDGGDSGAYSFLPIACSLLPIPSIL